MYLFQYFLKQKNAILQLNLCKYNAHIRYFDNFHNILHFTIYIYTATKCHQT